MKLKQADPSHLLPALESLARHNGYTKIFAKIPEGQAEVFLGSGYLKEAAIPWFYDGTKTAVFLCRYLDPERKIEPNAADLSNIIELSRTKMQPHPSLHPLPDGAIVRQCTEDDAPDMSRVYRAVFASYPFPIDDPEYIRNTMRDNIVYFGIEMEGELVALGSSEMDAESANVEMTDFATLPEYRGNGFAVHLLVHMEGDMESRNMRTAYTIARAASPGMNITFAKCGYVFGGRLKNNTNIAGAIESMNVWYKCLV